MIWSSPVVNLLTSVIQISAKLWQCSFRRKTFLEFCKRFLWRERNHTRRSVGFYFTFISISWICLRLFVALFHSAFFEQTFGSEELWPPTCRWCCVVKNEPVFRLPSLSLVPFALFIFQHCALASCAQLHPGVCSLDVDVFLPFSPLWANACSAVDGPGTAHTFLKAELTVLSWELDLFFMIFFFFMILIYITLSFLDVFGQRSGLGTFVNSLSFYSYHHVWVASSEM